MILICMGSTIFTEISVTIGGNSPDRIASNIITGIGFLGAGVIFKDGLSISGITTATAIWICAALGMAVGTGEYFIAITGAGFVLIVLVALQSITRHLEKVHQERTYIVTYGDSDTFLSEIETHMKSLNLRYDRRKDFKEEKANQVHYEISGSEKKLNLLNDFLRKNTTVEQFRY
jgi:putative Mg2+ transporter-C (MgtC) family protein